MHNQRGSLWHRWDLHVHTPASLVHNFPGSGESAWETYLDDLEALSENIRVIGVNDYLFIEGYERILEERSRRRLQNIDLILPVIEVRLNVFGGSSSKLSRVNAHVIFSDEVSPQVIRDQFHLTPRYAGLKGAWSGVLSRQALESLGSTIIESVPPAERVEFGTPMQEGFGNLTVSLSQLEKVLGSSFFRGRALLGVGKTEWADVKWTGGSIADKKNVINSADVVFIAAESPAAYQRARSALAAAGVNDRLLDCSDAHHLSTSPHKDRIGNTTTWIKASPTFGGLRQALAEFDQRVFVGIEPPELARVREHPSRYIDSVEIKKVFGSAFPEKWFNAAIPLNSGLIAIIGNRGSGKSALAESIALAGNTSREEDFSFLRDSKFREPKQHPATHFQVTLHWRDGSESGCRLSHSVSPGTHPLVQHLPQQYLEKLCNEVPKGAKTDFDEELERIIFAHLPIEQRMGAGSLAERVRLGSRARHSKLKELRRTLASINADIAAMEQELQPANVGAVKKAYETVRREWWELRQSPPPPVDPPAEEDASRAVIRNRLRECVLAEAHLVLMRDEAQESLADVRRSQAGLTALRADLERLAREHEGLLQENADLIAQLGLPVPISTFTIDVPSIEAAVSALSGRESLLVAQLGEDVERSYPSALIAARDEAESLRSQLSAPEEEYEEYRQRHREWEDSIHQLLGSDTVPDTVIGRRQLRDRLRKLPPLLATAKLDRAATTRQIHELLLREATDYASLYEPLEAHMRAQGVAPDYQLAVSTSLVDAGFAEGFLEERVNRHIAGSFCGRDESLAVVSSLLRSVDLSDTDSVIKFIEGVDRRLHFDYRTMPASPVNPATQVKKGRSVADVYDFVFGLEYLSPRYGLRFGAKPIHLLSPGEKGVLLLIFFLLAETNTRPLIIDQPEDNLDNQTVFKALVRCFHTAKARRQVIIVTHNPNLAVVCDADQVIVAAMDKDIGNEVRYYPGPIEESVVSRAIIDILEGTQPAFDNRSEKYGLHTQG